MPEVLVSVITTWKAFTPAHRMRRLGPISGGPSRACDRRVRLHRLASGRGAPRLRRPGHRARRLQLDFECRFLEGLIDPALEIRLGDVADPFLLRELSIGVDTIFHLAALIGIPYSYVAPAHYVRTNVEGTLSVLEAARLEGVSRVVHTSTSETYGSAQYEPMDESHPVVAQSPYAATKIAADQLATSYFRSFDLPVTTLRPFNTYGPRQSMRAVLPTIMMQALFADEIVVGSIHPVRDMNYVSDTTSAFLAAAESEDVVGHLFNIGSGTGRSIAEMIEAIQRTVGRTSRFAGRPRIRPAKSEVTALICDYGKSERRRSGIDHRSASTKASHGCATTSSSADLLRTLRRTGSDMRAVILAGGRGSRLRPFTVVIPKPLVPIAEMPILESLVRQLKAQG